MNNSYKNYSQPYDILKAWVLENNPYIYSQNDFEGNNQLPLDNQKEHYLNFIMAVITGTKITSFGGISLQDLSIPDTASFRKLREASRKNKEEFLRVLNDPEFIAEASGLNPKEIITRASMANKNMHVEEYVHPKASLEDISNYNNSAQNKGKDTSIPQYNAYAPTEIKEVRQKYVNGQLVEDKTTLSIEQQELLLQEQYKKECSNNSMDYNLWKQKQQNYSREINGIPFNVDYNISPEAIARGYVAKTSFSLTLDTANIRQEINQRYVTAQELDNQNKDLDRREKENDLELNQSKEKSYF